MASIPLTIKGPRFIGENGNPSDTFQKERFVLIFDFETNDLPHDSVAWDDYEPYKTIQKYKSGAPKQDRNGKMLIQEPSDPSLWPHAVQFCYTLYDNLTNEAKIVNEIIRLPVGVTMSPASQAIHKISLEYTQEKTKKCVNPLTGEIEYKHHPYIQEVLEEFMKDFQRADVIVAHNLRFDRNMLLAEMDRLVRNGNESFKDSLELLYSNKKEFCTANCGADVCKIEAINKIGKAYYKIPRLCHLYKYLFGYEPDESKLHDALTDVVVCMRCFYKMRYNIEITDKFDRRVVQLINEFSPPDFRYDLKPTNLQPKKPSSSSSKNKSKNKLRRSKRRRTPISRYVCV
jgi:DNA polymerase III epsilon subunit-like protein